MKKIFFSFLLVLPLSFPYATSVLADESPALARVIERALGAEQLGTTKTAIMVRDANTGDVLYERQGDELMNPASNIKLVTAAVALERFGPGETTWTRLRAESVNNGVIQGPLYVQSSGDPLIMHETVIGWAVQLRARGIKKITGGIVVDDLAFGTSHTPPGFDQKDADAAYRSPIGGFSVSYNAITVVIEPQDGQAVVRIEPPNDYIDVQANVRVVAGRGQSVRVESRPGEERTHVIVGGSIGRDAAAVFVRKRIEHPALFAGAVLAQAIKDVGIEFEGQIRRGESKGSIRLVEHESPAMLWQLILMNKWSSNFIAEQVFRRLGLDGSSVASDDRARAVYRESLRSLGVDVEGFAVLNGSGLYDGNLITARQLTQLLIAMKTRPYGADFIASLPVGGHDGSLRARFQGQDQPWLRGKTGTLNEVLALSGYAKTDSGREVVYAILFNDTPFRAFRLRNLQDQLVQAIISNL